MHFFLLQSLFPFLLIVSFLSINVELSLCQNDQQFTNCSSELNCGGIGGISYPFWGVNRASYCGQPGFEVQCLDNVPVFNMTGASYRILQMNTTNTRTVKVARQDYWGSICNPTFVNTTLNFSLFDYVSSYTNMTFYYQCPTAIMVPSTQSCNTGHTVSLVYYLTRAVGQPSSVSCTHVVIVPVYTTAAFAIEAGQTTVVSDAVDGGFSLQVKIDNDQCNKCSESGGQCGLNTTTNSGFSCFCADQAYASICNGTINASPSGESSMIIITGTLGSVAFCSLVVVVAGCFFRKRLRTVKERYHSKRQKKKVGNDMKKTVESLQFRLGTMETATNKFSDDNKLGEGGFGAVFKGTLGNGHEIAVKRLSKSSTQGVQEFQNEVVLVAKLQHRNLVRLLGFCLEGEETLLVYEYVPNKSLDKFLFEPKKREQLDWPRRCMIIGGIARGILYLHEDSRLMVIHRDLKASNILLDDKMNPKISDFGMAKMFGIDGQTQGNTERVVGTLGYMAPEYATEGIYSVKSDVFSFGILVLEITTGRKNFLGFDCRFPTLLAHAWQSWNEGKGLDLIDPILLKDSCRPDQVLRYIHIGLLCVQEDANIRPTMSSVVLMLKTETISLSKPERPAFFTGRSANMQDQIAANSCTINGLTISDDLPR